MPSTSAGATAAASLPDPAFYTMSGIMTPSQSQSQSWDPKTASLAALALQAEAEPPAHMRGSAWQERQLGRAALSWLLGDDPRATMHHGAGDADPGDLWARNVDAAEGAPHVQAREPPQPAFELLHEPQSQPEPDEFAPSAIVNMALAPIPDVSESANSTPITRVRRIDQ